MFLAIFMYTNLILNEYLVDKHLAEYLFHSTPRLIKILNTHYSCVMTYLTIRPKFDFYTSTSLEVYFAVGYEI